ncbi:MAG: diacylglycerol kinase family protein [Bacteroidia bacterium]|nr:diacylglycerol kinase family protein [Bacteroidia bacterium]
MEYLIKRIRSFGYAIEGIIYMIRTQAHARIHLLAIVIITGLGYYLKLSAGEWCWIVSCMGLVLSMEAMNTAIENLTDLASPEYHELAKKAKDTAAGAVLIAVIFCGIVWAIIFLPKLLH